MSTSKSKGCLFLASSLCDGLEDNNIKQVTTLLLNKEANPNTLIPTYGVTPFHLVIGNDSEAFAEEVTKLFLRHGGNPNVRSVDGLTPVHVAAAWGRVTVLELLLANGGDPLCVDYEGRSPFHYAFDGKYYKAIVVLGKYCENTIKEEKSTKYKITFDKLLINNGNVAAEYTASQISNAVTESTFNKNIFQKYDEEKFTGMPVKYFSDLDSDNSFNNDDQFGINSMINTAEIRIHEEVNKEKVLVNEIINQLSNSLEPYFRKREVNTELHSQKKEYDTSPSSTISTDNSMVCGMKEKVVLKNKTRRRSITPKYRRKIFKQNNVKVSLTPVCNTNDYIISKSPNFLIGESVQGKQEYLSPKISHKELKFKAFTPCIERNQSFQSQLNLKKEVARSTPRRRKQFYRQYSSFRKLKKNNIFTSSENTSPDTTNSLSPDHDCVKILNYELNKNVVVKLDESKYDDDPIVHYNFNENKEINKKCKLKNNVIEELGNNFEDLQINKINIIGKNTESLREHLILPENFLAEGIKSRINNTLNSFKENSTTSFFSFKTQSYLSVQEEYKYEEPDKGMALLERRVYTIPLCKSIEDPSLDKFWPNLLNLSMDIPLTNEALRRKLITLGDNPGPITNTTRQLYLKRLINLEKKTHNLSLSETYHCRNFSNIEHCEFNVKPFLIYGDWVNHLTRYKIIEKKIFEEFSVVSPSRKWREGTSKTCFNYLLLDPRISKDLPCHTENMTKSTIWSIFVSAIFYIGKGTRTRPYSHLKDAFDAWVSHKGSESTKIQQILNIWNEGYGVVCLHIFQNSIPVEAYTREAAMIDALGIQKLRNCKSGDYYGIAATWNKEEKCNFGRYLLYQAMQIFLCEGERQIFPQNL